MMQYDGCARISAILNSNARDLSVELGTIAITETKTEENRTVALSEATLTLLKKHLEIHSAEIAKRKGKIFGISYEQIWRLQKNEFKKILGDEEGEKVSTHWARASRAVHLIQKGYDLDTVKTIGGWKSADAVMKYLQESGYKARELMQEEPIKW